MPGYTATAAEGSTKSGLVCVHCKLLLREPVQTEEGYRLCKTCFADIQSLPDGTCSCCEVSTGSAGTFYPDKAVRREVLSIVVLCLYHHLGCSWKDQLKTWESHMASCPFKGVPCSHEGCQEILSQGDMLEHRKECPFSPSPCQYCGKVLPSNSIMSHESECDEALITCEDVNCSKKFLRKQIAEHNSTDCVVQICRTCDTKVFRDSGIEILLPPAHFRGRSTKSSVMEDLEDLPHLRSAPVMGCMMSPYDSHATVHLTDHYQNFQHHQMISEEVRKLGEELSSTNDIQESRWQGIDETVHHLKGENHNLKVKVQDLRMEMSTLSKEMKSLKGDIAKQKESETTTTRDHGLTSAVEKLKKEDAEKTSIINRLKREVAELQIVTETIKSQSQLGGVFGGGTGVLIEKDSIQRRGGGHTPLGAGNASEARAILSERRMEEMSRQVTTVKVHVQELELQLQASLASTHNGAFLWRIPDISRRRRDAIEERVTSIYSPPFYTGRNGYKMCVRAYLNGDGMGYKTHLSLFFVLMRGECDPLLKWPFEHKVSMILVDQTHRKHIVQTFKPTPDSSSFQQPTTDMNVASGCPQFTKLSVFDDESYVKNDVMFIKCIVDATKIFHP